MNAEHLQSCRTQSISRGHATASDDADKADLSNVEAGGHRHQHYGRHVQEEINQSDRALKQNGDERFELTEEPPPLPPTQPK
jgi:hypothetical protein